MTEVKSEPQGGEKRSALSAVGEENGGAKELPKRRTKSRRQSQGLARQRPAHHVFTLQYSERSVHLSPVLAHACLTCYAVIFAASLLTSLSLGYALGVQSSRANAKATSNKPKSKKPESPKDTQQSDSEEEDVADGDLSAVKPGFMEPCKMVRILTAVAEDQTHGEPCRFSLFGRTWACLRGKSRHSKLIDGQLCSYQLISGVTLRCS